MWIMTSAKIILLLRSKNILQEKPSPELFFEDYNKWEMCLPRNSLDSFCNYWQPENCETR